MSYRCYIDFETRSRAKIKTIGAKLYAEHPSTDILCVAYSDVSRNGSIRLIDGVCEDCPDCDLLWGFADDANCVFVAHNAYFEQCIWQEIMVKRYGFPEISIDRWRCTMAKYLAHGLPASLADAAASLNLQPKDMAGHKVMMRLSQPRTSGKRKGEFIEPEDEPDNFKKLYEYCKQDVQTERALDQRLRDLSPFEQRLWQIDQRVNHTGIHLDLQAVQKAIEFGERRLETVIEDFRKVTGGQVDSPRKREQLLKWSADNGLKLLNTQKTTIRTQLEKTDGSVVGDVRKALELLKESAKTSLAKYPAMMRRVNKDGICREMYRCFGAHTKRFTAQGVQWHNLSRPMGGANPHGVMASITDSDYDTFTFLYGDILAPVAASIRSAIIAPPGCKLLIADFKQIEARVLAWLAGQDDKLELFNQGRDLYCDQASRIYGYEVTKSMEERQVGKVADLAFGYGGGINACATMKANYGVDLHPVYPNLWLQSILDERDKADWSYVNYLDRNKGRKNFEPVDREEGVAADIIKQRWRKANPAIQTFWYNCQRAVSKAIRTGDPVECYKVTWFVHDDFLWCKLEGVECYLVYPYPLIGEDTGNFTYYGKIPNTQKWGRISAWGGKLTENLVQWISAILLMKAMIRLEDGGFPVYMHTHDEIVTTTSKSSDDDVKLEFQNLMETVPECGIGIPIACDVYEGVRYGK